MDSSDAAMISELINKYSEQPIVKQKSALLRFVSTDRPLSYQNVHCGLVLVFCFVSTSDL